MSKFLCNHDMHVHSFLSACCKDENMTPQTILQFALDHNYDTLCLTNHMWDAAVPGASTWYAPQTIEHVKQSLPLPETDKLRYVFGCETDYCGNGKLGLALDHFDAFSFVIIPPNHFHQAGFVRPEELCSAEDTAKLLVERLEEIGSMPLPFHKIGIAHMTTGLIYRFKNKYDVLELVDKERYYDAVRVFAKKGAGIELNGACFGENWQENADIELELYRIAKDAGCKFYLGSDAHKCEQLARITNVLPEVVERLGLTDEDRYVIPD